MPELPNTQALLAMQAGDLNELLAKPFHFRSVSQNLSGAYHAVGLAVGKSWMEHRKNVALAFPFVAEADPTDATPGTALLVYPQARIWFDFNAPNGDERLTFRIWHRHVAYDDVISVGPWTMWQEVDNARARREYLDAGNYHRQIYIQLVGYGPATVTATAVTVWVAGAEGIPVASDMDVSIDAGNLEVQIEAIPDDFGEKADSAIFAGVTDGIVPTAAGGNPTGTFAVRVHAGGWVKNWLAEPTLSYLSMFPDLLVSVEKLTSQMALLIRYASQEWLPVSGAAPTPVAGVTTNIPEAKSTTMDVGETMTFTPKVDGVRVLTATGAARLFSVIGRDIYVTVIVAVTTDAQVIADWAANATATALGTPTGTGGTFAAGYVGETLNLWTARTTGAAAGMVLRSDGTYGPEEADAATGATKVYQRGMNTAVDAQQVMQVVPPPEAVQGPSPLIEDAAKAEVAGSVDIPIPVSNYKFFSLTAKWTATAGDTYQWDVLARLDQGAAPGDLVNINDRFLPAGALGAAALSGSIFVNNPNPFKAWEMVLRRTKVNNNGPAALYCRFSESR